jgi:hypothetical protein
MRRETRKLDWKLEAEGGTCPPTHPLPGRGGFPFVTRPRYGMAEAHISSSSLHRAPPRWHPVVAFSPMRKPGDGVYGEGWAHTKPQTGEGQWRGQRPFYIIVTVLVRFRGM